MPTTLAKPQPWYPGINRSHRLSRGVVVAYPMWEGAGALLNDVSGNRHDIQWNSAATNPPTWSGGPWGTSTDFQAFGNGDCFITSSSPRGNHFIMDSDEFTTLCVVQRGTGAATSYCFLFMSGSNDSTEEVLNLHRTSGGTTRAENDYGWNESGGTVVASQWYVSMSRWSVSLDTAEHYVDGLLDSSEAVALSAPADVEQINLGARRDGTTQEWDGKIAGVIIWDRYLEDEEIRLLSADPFQIFREPDPYHLWWEPTAAADVGHDYLAASIRRRSIHPLIQM